jgi:predicted transcriptional regulator
MGKNLELEMLDCFAQLNEAEKKSIIQLLKTFLKSRKTPGRISIEQYNKELEEAEKRIEAGDFTTHEELIKEMKKW